MMLESEIKNLFRKYLEETITPEEFSKLFQLVKTDYNSSALDEVFQSAFVNPNYSQKGEDYDSKEILRELIEKIEKNEIIRNNQGTKLSVNRKISYRYWIAAASGLIFLFIGSYFLFIKNAVLQHSKLLIGQDELRNEIIPGGNKATLTLTKGLQIILDSAHNGRIAQEGDALISKPEFGKLTYELGKEKSGKVFYDVLSTPRGGQYQITLPDGSKVWLNDASSLRYPTFFSGENRNVELTGEAYFEVSKDSRHPFVVSAAGTTTEVLGTHFNINSYLDEPIVKITLVEGLVKVNSSVQILPGQQAQVSKSGLIQKLNADIKPEIGWKEGFFVFKKTPLKEVMKQISRWYDVSINYTDSINEHFNIIVRRDVSISKLLQLIEETGSVHFTLKDKQIDVRN